MELNIYNKYYNNNVFINNNIDKYINLFKKKKNIIEKLKSIEDEFKNKIQKIKEDYKKFKIEEFSNLQAIQILEKQKNIILILSKYTLQNSIVEKEFLKCALNFIKNMSLILMKKIKQPLIYHQDYNIKLLIPRCSYKFCNFKESCNYNYNKNKQICYQDHYVHNMIYADIEVLIEYIDEHFKDNMLVHNKEIQKSINTLSYVISHMEKELKSKCLYEDQKSWDSFHVSKKIITKIIKK